MNIAKVIYNDIANGEGCRTSVFVSGCENYCPGCFNEIAWDFSYGKSLTEAYMDEIVDSCDPNYISGITILGGEPLHPNNAPSVYELLLHFKNRYPNKTIWVYTGYIYEHLLQIGSDIQKKILNLIDILVDGPYIEKLKNISLKFRGSENQRIIDVKKSSANGGVVLWKEKESKLTSKTIDIFKCCYNCRRAHATGNNTLHCYVKNETVGPFEKACDGYLSVFGGNKMSAWLYAIRDQK